jgi:transposase-like protein
VNQHTKPQYDGSTRMTADQAEQEIRARIINLVESGTLTMARAADRFGLTRQRVSQIMKDHREGVARGVKFSNRLTPAGAQMYEAKPTGGYRWTQAALDELKAHIEGGASINATAAAFGIDPRHVRRRGIARQWMNPKTKEYNAKKDRVVELASTAKSFADLARRLDVSVTFVRETMRRRAPREHLRLCGNAPVRIEAANPDIPPVNWDDRARDLFPGDASLARSLARLASFVGVTREGHTVRIVPARAMEVV